MSDYYQLLQVQRNADDDTIKKAYRKLARQYHPDPNRSHFADEHMKLINAAYEVLSDPMKRHQYDERLAEAARRAVAPIPTVVQDAPVPVRTAVNVGLVWIGITALLVVMVFTATLYTLRESLPAIGVSLLPTLPPTRLPLLLPAATATLPPTDEPTLTVTPINTPTLEPSATPLPLTATRPPNTATATPARPTVPPTRVVPAYPPPVTVEPDTRIVRTELPNGPTSGGTLSVSSVDGKIKMTVPSNGILSEAAPSWSPLGLHIVFTEFNSGNLFVVDADGGLMTRVTSDVLMRDSAPVWAPVGSLIAFQSIRRDAYGAGNFGAARVFVVDYGSKQRRQVGDQPGRDMTWSPDGQWLAYQVPVGFSSTVYIINVDKPSQQYFFPTSFVRRMAWTLDSRQLVFEAFARDSNTDGKIDEKDKPDLYSATIQPVSIQRLSKLVTVTSTHGAFPGPASDGEYYPPIISVVQP